MAATQSPNLSEQTKRRVKSPQNAEFAPPSVKMQPGAELPKPIHQPPGNPEDGLLVQVERILQSDTLQNSEALRRLLRFLAEKSISGEADHLKEYTIAIEALEKPQSYDPRYDSTVRIQMARLRRKLDDYYREEGKDDLLIIELPKHQFKLACVWRPAAAESAPEPSPAGMTSRSMWTAGLTGLICASLIFTAGWVVGHKHPEAPNLVNDNNWNADLDELWHPFLAPNRALILTVGDPLFVLLQPNTLYVRSEALNRWTGEKNVPPPVEAVRKLLGATSVQPSHYFAPFGALDACFLLGRSLGMHKQNISLIRMSELSAAQLANNNVVILGKQIRTTLQGLPIQVQLEPDANGIHNLHPDRGEPGEFIDDLTQLGDNGDDYVLISHLPGPQGTGDIEVFSSRNSFAYVGAVQWFTDPALAHILVGKLRKGNGEIPRYYQVLLKVRSTDQVPTQTTFVLSRELQ